MNKSQRVSIRLLISEDWRNPLSDISKAHMISRLALLRKYIFQGMTADLEEIKEGFERLKRIEATKKELSQKVKAHKGNNAESTKLPLEL